MSHAINPGMRKGFDGLSFLWLEITAKCNLTCSHCYADSGPQRELYGNMTYEDWCRVIAEAAQIGCRRLQFIGGEPTLHPRLADLVNQASHWGFELIEVFTNATRLGKELINCFRSNCVHVATSFYSTDPSVHEGITRSKGSWERTVGGIRAALAAGLPVRVGVIETHRNAGHGPQAIEFVKRLGVKSVNIDQERGVGRGGLLQLNADGERYDQLCGQCWKGKLCVTSTGDVFPCVFSRASRIGHVKSGLHEVVQGSTLRQFRLQVLALGQKRTTNSCNPDVGCSPDNCYPNSSCGPDNCNPNDSCNPHRES